MNAGMFALLSLVFLAMMAATAGALTISGEERASLCQCETIKLDYEVCSAVSGTYDISAEGTGARWVAIAPTALAFSGSGCEKFYVFASPECYATSSTFPINLNVSGPESGKLTLNLGVNQCHTFDYSVNPTYGAARPCQESSYDIFVRNTGNFADEFVFTQAGLPDSWVSYPKEKFGLGAGEEMRSGLKVSVPCSADAISAPFSLALSNTLTNASKAINLAQNVESFVPAGHNLPERIASCSEQDKNIAITVANLSDASDELALSLSDYNGVSLSEKNLSLAPNSSGEAVLQIARMPPQEKKFVFAITSKRYSRAYNTSITLGVSDCYNLQIERVSDQNEYCFGPVEQEFILRNLGTEAVEGIVQISGIGASPREISLASGEVTGISALLAPGALGKADAVISVESPLARAELPFSMVFRDCYAFSAAAPSETIDVNCASGKIVDINISNDGDFNQEFALAAQGSGWITFTENRISVPAKETKTVYAFCAPKNSVQGRTDANILVTGHGGAAKSLLLKLNIVGDCSRAQSADALPPLAPARKEVSFDFSIRNDSNSGFSVEDVNVENYASRADLNRGVFLDANQSVVARITLSLDAGLAGKDINALVVVTTSGGVFKKVQQLHVPEDSSPVAGLFAEYSSSAIGAVVLFAIIVVAVLLLRGRKASSADAGAAEPAAEEQEKRDEEKPKKKSRAKK